MSSSDYKKTFASVKYLLKGHEGKRIRQEMT